MEIGIKTVMKFGNECTSLQMAVYCETFKGTKKVQCYNLVITRLDICFWLPVKSKFRQPTFLPLAIAESCTETLKNNNKLHKNRADRKCNRIFGCLFVKANPDCFQSPFRFDTWYRIDLVHKNKPTKFIVIFVGIQQLRGPNST